MHPAKWEEHFVSQINAGLDGERISVSVGDTDLICVVASTKASRTLGLAEHTEIPDDGMIFIYDSDSSARYQRISMSIDASIWFFSSKGELVSTGWDGSFATAEAPYRYVLETSPDLKLVGQLRLNRLDGMPSS